MPKKHSNRSATSKPSLGAKAAQIASKRPKRLVGGSRLPKSLVEFFRQSPLMGVELDLERDRETK